MDFQAMCSSIVIVTRKGGYELFLQALFLHVFITHKCQKHEMYWIYSCINTNIAFYPKNKMLL